MDLLPFRTPRAVRPCQWKTATLEELLELLKSMGATHRSPSGRHVFRPSSHCAGGWRVLEIRKGWTDPRPGAPVRYWVGSNSCIEDLPPTSLKL